MLSPAIRRATPSDAAALAAFAAVVFPLGCPETDPADLAAYIACELTPERFVALLDDPNILILLAESSQRIVAYMVIALRSPHPHLTAPAPAEFRKLYLDPAYHGTGLSSALTHCAISILNAEGPRPIWLSVFSENSRAIVFYKKWDFRIVGPLEFVVGNDRQKDFLMLRDTTSDPLCDTPRTPGDAPSSGS
jgi:ribosomal protein S18 acetylase RimI-like enzyme